MALYFIYVPNRSIIRLAAIPCCLVDTIEHECGINDGTAVSDVMSKDSMYLAAGISLYHVQASNIGEKVGRLVVIKQRCV